MSKFNRFYKILGAFLFTALLIAGVTVTRGATTLEPLVRSGSTVYHYDTTDPVMIPTSYTEQTSELRGVWVATVFNINMPLHTSETQYKAAYDDLIDDMLANNMNAILFQVRPQNDAFYVSDYATWSRWLTGTEGQNPGWDVMEYMIQTAHANNIEFHAWMNPYRVGNSSNTKAQYLNTLHPDNFAAQNPDLVVAGKPNSNGIYPYILNPGEPLVKQYIVNVVEELMEKYPVDGIHFDDYFYPYSGIDSDTATYDEYKLPGQTITQFRIENVNDVIRGVKESVDAHNDLLDTSIKFGVSPFGIWASDQQEEGGSNTSPNALSSLRSQYADSKRWVEEEWVHYINPQVYWVMHHNLAPYADVVDWWASITRGTDVDLIIGHSIANAHSWDSDEIMTQLRYNQKHPEITGSIMYSASFLNGTNMINVRNSYWTEQPLSAWQESNVENPTVSIDGTLDGSIYRSNVTITLTSEETIYYRFSGENWTLYDAPIDVTENGEYTLYTKAINSELEESLVRSTVITIAKQNFDTPTIEVVGEQIGSDYVVGSNLTITAQETIYVAINHGSVGAYELYTEPITLTSLGSYFVRAKTVNAEGIESEEVTLGFRVVEECYPAPVMSVSGDGTMPYYQSALITLTGDTGIEYRINNDAWTPYNAPFTLDDEGEYTVEYRNTTGCANTQSETIIIDQTPPSEPGILTDSAFDGWYYTEPVDLTIESEDTVYFRLHNGRNWTNWQAYTDPLFLAVSVTYTLEYYAVDEAGNTTETFETRIRVNLPVSETNPLVIRNGIAITYYQSDEEIRLPSYTEKSEEIRAIWVSTVFNIDVPRYTNEQDYKDFLSTMLDRIKDNNFNTVFFQVRPMNDAFYDSSLAPLSRYITGTEGDTIDFDILEYVTQEAHKRGLELHAWLNPYRVSTGSSSKANQLASLHDDNFAKQNPHLVIQDNNGYLILNPGEPEVREYVTNIVNELMENYAINGIHFDDYFYSYSGMSNAQDADAFSRENPEGMTLHDWRRDNVNQLVKGVFEVVEDYNMREDELIKFGISPFGIWASNQQFEGGSNTSPNALSSYISQYADSKKWVEEGWLHYINPQLYWEFEHSVAPYADLVDWWANLTEDSGVDLIIGHGFYRYADGSWSEPNELLEQLRYNTQYESIIGSAFFTYNTLNSQHANVIQGLDRLHTHYWTDYVGFSWESRVEPMEPLECDEGYEEIDGECVIIDDNDSDNGNGNGNGEVEPEPENGLSGTVIAVIIGGTVAVVSLLGILIRKLIMS